LAAFDPPEVEDVEEVVAAGVEEELSFDFDDADPLDEVLSEVEEDLRLSVR
jgi:hypothetical protein